MSGHQFGSMRNQMGPSGAPPGAGPSGEVQRFYAGGSPNFNEQTGQATGAAPGSFDMNSFGMNPQPLAQGNGAPPPTGGPATMPQGGQRPQGPRVTAGERLSPGVYRGSDGSLVGKNGRPLPNQGGGGQGGGSHGSGFDEVATVHVRRCPCKRLGMNVRVPGERDASRTR